MRCDVAIVGGGITGAMVAEHLTALGHDVVADRPRARRLRQHRGQHRDAAMGDRPAAAPAGGALRLRAGGRCLSAQLQRGRGPDRARGAARARHAPSSPRDTRLSRGRRGRPARTAGGMRAAPARRPAGRRCSTMRRCSSRFGFDRAAAIVSPGSAEADPLSLCHAPARGRGRARRAPDPRRGRAPSTARRNAAAVVARQRRSRSRPIMSCWRPAMSCPTASHSDLHRVASSWAIATAAAAAARRSGPGRALVWEASEDYIYCRTTTDGRIVFGGEDEDSDDPDRREAAGPEKTHALLRQAAGAAARTPSRRSAMPGRAPSARPATACR